MEKLYELDTFFKEQIKNFHHRGLFKVYPSFKEEIDYYEDLLKNSHINFVMCSQKFTASIHLYTTPLNYFKLRWDIDSLTPHVKNYPIHDIPLESNKVYSDYNNLNKEKLIYFASIKIDTPIILAYIEPINTYYVIDGNHRFHAAKIKGDKTIGSIILKPIDHIKFMEDELSKNLYIIHHNMFIMNNLHKNKSCKTSHNLDRTSFYPISGIKQDICLWKNILLNIIISLCQIKDSLSHTIKKILCKNSTNPLRA